MSSYLHTLETLSGKVPAAENREKLCISQTGRGSRKATPLAKKAVIAGKRWR
jgi:hypothetical protein